MSAFRAIRPSTDTKDELPAVESSLQGANIDSNASLGKGRRRRVPSHVSQNACTSCKRARAKCDGEEPAPCTRCISRDVADQCVYEVHVKTAKEELVRKVKDLEEKYSLLKLSVDEKDRWIERVLQFLNDETAASFLDKINSGHLDHELLHILRRPPMDSRLEPSSSAESARRLSDGTMDPPGDVEMNERTTNMVHDETLANHLMGLYFTWVHPVHMFFSERHFTSSLRAKDLTYCNAAMINAMCAVGCCYLADEDGNEVDAKRHGQRFYQQAWEEIQAEKKMTLLSSVTYAILFLFELNQGRARNASSHLRLAVESLRAVDRRGWTDEAFQLSLWGIQTLNTAWAAFTYQKPAAPLSPRAMVFIGVELDSPDAFWQPYKRPDDDSEFERPSYAIETAKEFTKLNQIIHETINVYCGSRGRVSAAGILQLYQRFLEWRELLPAHLGSTSMFDGALPHVFALHIHFAVAICQLFAPVLSTLDSPARERILSMTIQNAKDGLDIYQRYRALYSNRLQPTLLSFCLVHLADVMVRYSEQRPDEALVVFCLETLSEANGGFAYIGALQAMFCETVVERGMGLPPRERLLEMMGGRNRHSLSREEKLDCCERLTYAQPVDLLVERLNSTLADEFEQEWRSFSRHSFGGSDPPTNASSDQAATENPPPSRGLRIQRLVNP